MKKTVDSSQKGVVCYEQQDVKTNNFRKKNGKKENKMEAKMANLEKLLKLDQKKIGR